MQQTNPAAVGTYLRGLQQSIIAAVEKADGGTCLHDAWHKAPGEQLQGNGLTCILEGGALFERAGCGFSQVRGPGCRLRPRRTGLSWPARHSRRWACRWCSIRAIRTCRSST
jgi:coproporphyrinogen III oxidase